MTDLSPAKPATALTPTGVASAPFIAVERDLAKAEASWRDFERVNSGRLFQKFDWASSWCETQGRALGVTPAIVTAHGVAGELLALMPLGARRRGPFGIVEWLGGAHASYNLPLSGNGGLAFGDDGQVNRFLRAVARAIGDIDAIALRNQPQAWDGARHPFSTASDVVAIDEGFERTLEADGDALIARILSSDARRKLRAKERRLGEFGALKFGRASTPAEAGAMLEAFLAQKRARFREQKLANPFAAAGAAEFLERATVAGLQAGAPAIALYGLSLGERIAAVFGGPEDGGRFSAMFTSFDDAEDIGRHSPGDVLLRALVKDLCDRGVAHFDLGVGEARYKRGYCDRNIPIFETHLACTPSGLAISRYFKARAVAKRIIKRNPRLLSLARRILALRG